MRLLTSSFLAVVLASTLATARADNDTTPPPPADAPPPHMGGEHHHKETELGKRMETMGRAFKKLRKQITDASQNASSLELVATMRQAAEESINLTPEKADSVPQDQRAKFIADYQDGIKKLIAKFDALTESLKANKNDEAEKELKDISSFQREEHHDFRKEHPHPPGPPPAANQ